MIYLLYGADTYRSRGKLREIIDECRHKAGTALEMYRFDGEEDDFAGLAAITGGQSLFGGAKKLIVIEHPFVSERHFAAVRDFLRQGGVGGLVVFWDGAIGGDAKKMIAEIEPLADKTQVFDVLQGDKLARWIKKESIARGFNFAPSEITRLAALGGDDLWTLSNEMEKIGLGGAGSGSLSPEMAMKDMTFLLGDTFFANPQIALRCLLTLLSRGEEEMRMFGYLAGMARTALAVKSAADSGHPLPSSYKIHPFVAKKTAAAVRGVPVGELTRRLMRFFDEDIKIKTGIAMPADALFRMLTSRMAVLPKVL
ncbi:MAG: hypothetical protein WAP52_03590 [Candidatus Sungiibacteriota bacterium]